MDQLSLNERVEKIKGSNPEIDRLVEEYKPFIASCTEKVTGRYVRYGEDDELSIAMMAFVEAIEAYNSQKGSFLSFAKNVITRRIIDYYRKEEKHKKIILINEYADQDGKVTVLDEKESIKQHEENKTCEHRKMEILQLKEELLEWNISFDDLVEASPGQKRTRKMCERVLRFIISQPEILETIRKKRYLPVKKIAETLGMSQKRIERMRKYIIAALVVVAGDYPYIKEYVKFRD